MSNLKASLDIGTNSVLLLVCKLSTENELVEVQENLRMPRLGENAGANRMLNSAAVNRTLVACQELLAELPNSSHGMGITAATAAVRNAANRKIFLQAFEQRFGHAPRLISGSEEAATVFLGTMHDMNCPGHLLVNLDVGGGSTEVTAGESPAKCDFARSLNIGCVSSSEAFELQEISHPANHQLLRREVSRQSREAAEQILTLAAGRPLAVVLSGGTASAFAVYRQKCSVFSREAVHGFQAEEQQIADAAVELAAMPLRERANQPGVEKQRAAIFPTGLLIMSEMLRLLKTPKFTVSTRGLRFGLVLRLRRGELTPSFSWP